MQDISSFSFKRYEISALGFLAPVRFGRADVDAFVETESGATFWTGFAGFGALLIPFVASAGGLFVFAASATIEALPQSFVGHGQWVFSS